MEKPSIKCALLGTLVAKHGWGTPIETETLLSLSAVERHEYVEARETLAELQETPVLLGHGFRGVQLNNSAFGALANVLYYECNWKPFEIKLRLKHYEGWETHDWAE